MRKEYCCKKHATRIWHAKWSKSLKNEGFRELMWTCPLCSLIGNCDFLESKKKRMFNEHTLDKVKKGILD